MSHKKIENLFVEKYRDAKTELQYKNLYELLICVILSAQCTDKRVNMVTPNLFSKYPDIESLSKADISDVKGIISSISFFNTKAKNIINMAKQVASEFGGEIPLDSTNLKKLSGVGQKTANVVLLEFCGKNLMAVDTHVFRVSHRLGLSSAKNVEGTEKDLNQIFTKNRNILHQGFVLFGRYICKAIKPECDKCFVYEFCKYNKKSKILESKIMESKNRDSKKDAESKRVESKSKPIKKALKGTGKSESKKAKIPKNKSGVS